MTRHIRLAVSASILALAGMAMPAHAALVTITPGSPIVTPAVNDVLGAGVSLSDNATLVTNVAGVRLDYFFIGSESGFTNTLVTAFGSHAEANTIPGLPGTSLFGGTQAAAGAVSLSFTSSGFGGSLGLGTGDASKSIALGYLKDLTCAGGFALCMSATATDYILFALDDSGAGPDDNHDDYVGVLVASRDPNTEVPLPAAAWLLLSGIAGLFGVSRRRAA